MKILIITALLALPVSAFAETEEFIFDVGGQQNRHLRVNVLHGGIVVRGYDGDQFKVTADFDEVPVPEITVGGSGLMNLPNLANDLQVNQDDGMVIIRAGTEGQPVQLAIQVPRETRLTLTVSQGGDIRIDGVAGEMELQNSSGKINIEGIRNTVVANAHSDDLYASFAIADLPGASTFSSWSGNVELSLPANLKAELRWRSNYGEVLSDLAVTDIRTISAREDTGDSARVEGYTVASVNGGGPEISATSYSGNVVFKKTSP